MVNDKKTQVFFDGFLFPKVFRTFRIAIQPAKLIICFLAIVVICLAGWIMDLSKTVVQAEQGRITELQIYISSPAQLPVFIDLNKQGGKRIGVFSALWRFGSEKFNSALRSLFQFDVLGVAESIAQCSRALVWAARYNPVYTIVFFAVTLAVISLAGGATCRIAALQFALGEKPGLTDAVLFGLRKFPSFFTAPLIPMGIIIVMGSFVTVLGLVGNIPVAGELLIGLCMPLTLIAGALMTVIATGAIAGLNLMFPTIAYEDSDSFDAISRSFSYVYAKPWRMGFYSAVAVVYGAVCYIFVRFFAFVSLWISYVFLQIGVLGGNRRLVAVWPEPALTDFLGSPSATAQGWSVSVSAMLVHLFILAVIGAMIAFVMSFYFSASTIIYALMRNRVDNTALDDVCTHSGPDELRPQPRAIQPESQHLTSQGDLENPPSLAAKTDQPATEQ